MVSYSHEKRDNGEKSFRGTHKESCRARCEAMRPEIYLAPEQAEPKGRRKAATE